MAFESKPPAVRALSVNGDFPKDLPMPNKALGPDVESWARRLNQWYFDFKTVLQRIQEELEDAANGNTNAGNETAEALSSQVAALQASITSVSTSLATLASQVAQIHNQSSAAGSTPTGDGFAHVTVGVFDPAAKLVENSDVKVSAGIVESKLALNFPTHSNANDPTSDEKDALAGTSGTPSTTNKYVTDSDSRFVSGDLGYALQFMNM